MSSIDRRPRSVLLRWCALGGLLAPITFVVGWVAGGVAQPDAYSLVDDQVSDLGALTADQAWIYNQIGANLTGLLVAALACGLWRAVSSTLAGRVGVVALAVTGVGVFFDGWLRLDCREIDAGCSAGGTSWLAIAHQIESLITVTGMIVAVFALARAFKKSEHWQDLRTPTLIVGFASVGGILGGTVLTGLEIVGGGLAARVGLTVWFAWLAPVSYRLWRIAREDEHSDAHPVGSLEWRDRDSGR